MMNNKPDLAGMTLIVKTITRLTAGLILIYGIYIVFQGHRSPGGGFAGGVIIALSLIHLVLAFGRDIISKKLDKARAITLVSLAALILLCVTTLNFIGGRHFLAATRLITDTASALLVGAGLFLVFLVLVSVKEGSK